MLVGFPVVRLAVCVQASSWRCQGGGGVEEVLGAEETPQRVGLHAQEPVQKRRGVSTFSSRSSLWYDRKPWTVDRIRFSADIFNVASSYFKKHLVQASCFISSVVYIATQLLQNHSCRCGPTSVQSAFIASYKASVLLRLNAQWPTGCLLALFVSGRFDEAVIEERRKAAEAMFLFTTNIPALYNSPHLQEFLRVRTTHMLTEKTHTSTRGWEDKTFHSPSSFHFLCLSVMWLCPLLGWWGHQAVGSHVLDLRGVAPTPSHPTSQAEGLGLRASRGGGGYGGPSPAPRPGQQPGPGDRRTGACGRGLQWDGRHPHRGRAAQRRGARWER